MKGYIYLEAYKQPHVKAAIDSVGSLRMGQYKQMMVPIKEMTDVLRSSKGKLGLKAKQWVRLTRGIYKDDIAQVDYIDVAQNKVNLKLLPRIDYTRYRGALRVQNDDAKRKKKTRPTAKPFDPEGIRAIGGDITTDAGYLMFEGGRYDTRGFLYKEFNMNAVVSDGVKPTLAELEKFEEAPENADLELNGTVTTDATATGITHYFSPGDNVEVAEGELLNLQAKVVSVDGDIVKVLPKHKDLQEIIEFQAGELRKYFSMGDHVKVTILQSIMRFNCYKWNI